MQPSDAMSTPQRGRHYCSSGAHKTEEGMYRQPSYDRSFDSVRYPSNASQPSLSHSITTYTESTPSSVCRPEFGDYLSSMSQSDCGASLASEVPASFDDTSDIDEAPASNASKPTLIKFVEPVVQRDHAKGESRLTGMKKKKMQRIKANAGQHEGDIDVDSLPILGFADSRTSYASDDSHHKDSLNFPGVPPRDAHVSPQHEQWNVDAIDIALDDLVLDKGKVRFNQDSSSPFSDAPANKISSLRMRANMANMRGGAANSVLDETQQQDRPHLAPTRSRTLSDARRAPRPPPVDAPLPPLPALPSPSTTSQESGTPSTVGKIAGLQPSHDHPLAITPTAEGHTASRNGSLISDCVHGVSTPESEENVFAFRPPSLSGHGNEHTATVRASRFSRSTDTRTSSITSSNHSSLRNNLDLDPREVIQRARVQALTCGLDAEIGLASLDVEADIFGLDSGIPGSTSSVQAEDLPPLLSNHYLQGKVDQAEFERLNRMPERVQAAAAAAAASASHGHRLSHKHLAKHKKNVGAASVVQHYEPISILRAEAAFLKEDTKKSDGKRKKDRLWATGSTATASLSDVSSLGDGGHQRLKSFKSSMRLKNLK